MTTAIELARRLAVHAHAGQTYGPGEPYTDHLHDVAMIVIPYDKEEGVVLAYLHDIVEDTTVTIEEIYDKFGLHVAVCVALLTDEPGANRRERKARSHAKLARAGRVHYVALVVKAADRLANLRACVQKGNAGLLAMYRREHDAFRQAAYRPGLCDDLWNEMDALLERTPA